MSWPVVELASVSVVFNGKTPSKADQRTVGHPVLKIRDVSEQGEFRGKLESFVDPEFAEKYSTKQIQLGDSLILNAAHNSAYVGSKFYRAEPTTQGLLATGEWLLVRPDPTKLDADYKHHWLTSKVTRQKISGIVNGIHLYPKDLARLRLPLPPLDEQRRIAAILDQAEELRAQRRAAIALLDQLPQAIFLEMFGDPATNPKRWDTVPLASLCNHSDEIKCGPFGTQLHRSDFTDYGIPLWGIKNVNAGFHLPTHEFVSEATGQRLTQYSILPNDIVMTRKGTVGNCAVYPSHFPPGLMHSDLLRIRLDISRTSPVFVSHQLQSSRDVEHQISLISGGAIMAGINVSKLKILALRVPPSHLQFDFAARVESVSRVKSIQVSSLARLDALIASLQSQSFSRGPSFVS